MMNSVVKMTPKHKNPSAQTTQPLIALYCGSRLGNKPIYQEKAIALAQALAELGFGLDVAGAVHLHETVLHGPLRDPAVAGPGVEFGAVEEPRGVRGNGQRGCRRGGPGC